MSKLSSADLIESIRLKVSCPKMRPQATLANSKTLIRFGHTFIFCKQELNTLLLVPFKKALLGNIATNVSKISTQRGWTTEPQSWVWNSFGTTRLLRYIYTITWWKNQPPPISTAEYYRIWYRSYTSVLGKILKQELQNAECWLNEYGKMCIQYLYFYWQ